MTKRALLVLSSLCALTACGGTPSVTGADAGPTDASGNDAGSTPDLGWHTGTDFPEPIAFGAAMVLPSGGTDYLYVIGGANGTFGALGTLRAAVQRAPIMSDHSLGAWESAGDIDAGGGAPIPLAAHGAIRIWGETGEDGVAIAGGGTTSSALPFVLGGYVQFDGSLGEWGRFDPMLTSGQSFGTFNPFEAHQLALIGGLSGTTPTARVLIAAIENGSMAPTWRPGPDLPAPRFGHGAVVMDRNLDDEVQGDIYLIGGANDDGTMSDILRTSRDATMEVISWEPAGTLPEALVFPGVAVIEDRLYVMGGIAGDAMTGAPSAAVRMAVIDEATHQVGSFTDVADATLPTAIGAPMVALDGAYIYLVGGLAGSDHAASTAVVYGRLP
jgi:hypothetical protein